MLAAKTPCARELAEAVSEYFNRLLARRGKLPHVRLPDDSVRFRWHEVRALIDNRPARIVEVGDPVPETPMPLTQHESAGAFLKNAIERYRHLEVEQRVVVHRSRKQEPLRAALRELKSRYDIDLKLGSDLQPKEVEHDA